MFRSAWRRYGRFAYPRPARRDAGSYLPPEANISQNAWIIPAADTLAAVLAIGAGLFFKLPVSQTAAVLLAIALVMGAEIFNTAIENTLDLICGEYNEKVKKTKDIAAGAVLICAIVAAVIGVMVFLPPFLEWMGWLSL